jgi:hypothetical protein
MSPETYTKGKFASGFDPKNPTWDAFTQGKIYMASADGSVVPSPYALATVLGCKVANAVKEVFYTVRY